MRQHQPAVALDPSKSASPPAAGRPVDLPWSAPLADFRLGLPVLRAAAEWSLAHAGRMERKQGTGNGQFKPPVAEAIGERLTPRIATLLGRPACAFAHSWLWRYERGGAMQSHADRPGLDITMSVPLALVGGGTEGWPLYMRQPSGEVLEWPGKPGTVLLFDGRWRPHWRCPWNGDHACVLLLHWRTPTVVWRGMLEAAECAELIARGRGGVRKSTLDRCADLARLAVPPSDVPVLALHCGDFPKGQADAQAGWDVRLLVPLESELGVTFDGFDPIDLHPGDGLAFPAREQCRLSWCARGGTGTVLMGQARSGTHPK